MNKRTKIYLVILIWSATLLQLFINSSINREKGMVTSVFAEEGDNVICGSVKAYGYYSDKKLSEEKRRGIARKLARDIGITGGYELETKTDEENETTVLTKKGQQGDTTIKIITLVNSEKNVVEDYILMEIDLKNTAAGSVYELKEKIEEIYDGIGVNAGTNIYLKSQLPGKLSEVEIDSRTQEFLESVKAKEIKTVEFDSTVCVYGYSRSISNFVYQNNDRVNVNIAFTYDEEENVTYVHRAIPFVDKSF